jgi:hypothetical protein
MRRTILLLATAALVLLLVGGVAVSKQLQDATTTAQSSGDVSIQSTTQKASFTSGSGATFLRVAVSDHGNLLAFESPQAKQSVQEEGYALCSSSSGTINGYEMGLTESGFGTPTFTQPNGAGTFPLTVTRNTTDGKFQLKQVWAKPDATEKDVTVTMTVKNLSSTTISEVLLSRFGDIDAGGYDANFGTGYTDRGTRTADSVLLWDDSVDVNQGSMGLMLTALTFQTTHQPFTELRNQWSPYQCHASAPVGPVRDDLAMRMTYSLGNIAAGASKTVKFEYSRM